jgi:DNA-binding CsgD family transcriptional regulator
MTALTSQICTHFTNTPNDCLLTFVGLGWPCDAWNYLARWIGPIFAGLWAALTAREQQVVALCCLEYSDHEIARMLDIAYGTARTHLYKAIDKLGINKKSELQFLLRNWDFSKFDRDF